MTFPKIVSKVYLTYLRCVRAMFGMFLAYVESLKAFSKNFDIFCCYFLEILLKNHFFIVKNGYRII